jgi:tetratricopeptide (TPR) repeat protein
MKKIYLFSFGLLLHVSNTSFAGNDNRDGLSVKQLTDSCWKYMNQQDTTESKKYCEFLLTVSVKTNNDYAIGNAYRTMANYYLITNNYSRSIEFYDKSVKLSKSLTDKEGQLLYAECLLNFGLIFHKNGDFKTALEKYMTAEKIYYKY